MVFSIVLVCCVFARFPLIAQLVEQLPFKERVAGSIPAERTLTKMARL